MGIYRLVDFARTLSAALSVRIPDYFRNDGCESAAPGDGHCGHAFYPGLREYRDEHRVNADHRNHTASGQLRRIVPGFNGRLSGNYPEHLQRTFDFLKVVPRC